MSPHPITRSARRAFLTALATGALLCAAAQTAHGAPPIRFSLAAPAGGEPAATATGTLTFHSASRYDASFCIQDERADASGAGLALRYTYADGSTHWTRSWRNDGGAGSRSCHRAWANWPPAIRSIELVLTSDRFGSGRGTLENPHAAEPAPSDGGPVIVPVANRARGVPAAPAFGRHVDRYAPTNQIRKGDCARQLKPGVADFRGVLLEAYPKTHYLPSSTACDGEPGGHDAGLAIDWGLYGSKTRHGDELVEWLTATDQFRNRHAMARRLGISMLIWENRIWTSGNPKWRRHRSSCAGGRGGDAYCHRDHVHIEFGRPGSCRQTSWWNPNDSRVPPRGFLQPTC
jgi:hypothetical protein